MKQTKSVLKIELGGTKTEKTLLLSILITFSFIIHSLITKGGTPLYVPQVLIEGVCVLYLFKHLKSIDKISILYILMLLICFAQYFFHRNTFRVTNVIYTGLFCSVLMSYRMLLKKKILTIASFVNIIKLFLVTYSVVLLLQQIQSLIGLEIFNINSDFSSKFKLNSLTWESSNLALIVPAYLYAFIKSRELQLYRKYSLSKDFRDDRMVWLLCIYLSFTCGSMSAFLSVGFFMLYFVEWKTAITLSKYYVIVLLVLIPIITRFEIFDFSRIQALFNIIIAGDIRLVASVDPSAACRIVPYFIFIDSINPLDLNFWLGHGTGEAEEIAKHMIIFDKFDRNIGCENITSYFYDYGILVGILFLTALKKCISNKWMSFSIAFYVFIYSVITMNHHALWLFILLLTTVHYFEKCQSKCRRMPLSIRLKNKWRKSHKYTLQ